MWPRLRLDLSAADLAHAAVGVTARDPRGRLARVERLFGPGDQALACLSVRSGLDLWLSAAALPPGSEVLVSALTIPDMLRVLRAHGLVPVPVDVDPSDLGVSLAALERQRTPRTRAVLIAHLFGARLDLGPVVAFCHAHGLFLLEDAAQAFAADGWRGDPGAEATFFSFGTIKTATALGGGLVVVRDAERRERMRVRRDQQPLQPRSEFALRTLRAMALHLLSLRPLFGGFARATRAMGRDFDELLHGAVRGFRGDLLPLLRRRPSAPLLKLLERRLRRYPRHRIEARARAGAALADDPRASTLGALAHEHTHWIVPVRARDPERVVARLREAGFDATRRSSLAAASPAPPEVTATLEELVFLPVGAVRDDAAREQLVQLLAEPR
jgi:dTDP-4-amino-4,6-dideoxygalactose transaminase